MHTWTIIKTLKQNLFELIMLMKKCNILNVMLDIVLSQFTRKHYWSVFQQNVTFCVCTVQLDSWIAFESWKFTERIFRCTTIEKNFRCFRNKPRTNIQIQSRKISWNLDRCHKHWRNINRIQLSVSNPKIRILHSKHPVSLD